MNTQQRKQELQNSMIHFAKVVNVFNANYDGIKCMRDASRVSLDDLRAIRNTNPRRG